MSKKSKMQVSATYGKQKARITRCMCDTCKPGETVGWRVTFDGYSVGRNTWQQALDTALQFWMDQR